MTDASTTDDSALEVFHYTTAAGLQGILTEQRLRATNMRYLNDSEERTGFFERRLTHLMSRAHDNLLGGGGTSLVGEKDDVLERTIEFLRAELLTHEAYSLSLSYPPDEYPNDGLLSQWRGYGTDGGYAIVMDIRPLLVGLQEEFKLYGYSSLGTARAQYFPADGLGEAQHDEVLEAERYVMEALPAVMLGKPMDWMLSHYLNTLSTSYKHCGFREENEIRIVAAIDSTKKVGRLSKPVKFYSRSGQIVPFIELFGFKRESDGKSHLPIKRIIVGPHPDKEARAHAVRMFVDSLELDVKVTCSGIPYVGR